MPGVKVNKIGLKNAFSDRVLIVEIGPMEGFVNVDLDRNLHGYLLINQIKHII